MNEQLAELKMNNLEKDVTEIKKTLKDLPDVISKRLDESINLKIENAKQELKIDFYKWLVPIILGLLFSVCGVVFNYIK
jgi:regulator of replication initiation timing